MENLVKDTRFSHLATDPRFRRAPKYERKVKIDKRFQSMFTDDKFKVSYAVDKRGRPVSYSSNENLRKYYALSSDEEEDDGKSSAENSEDEERSLVVSSGGETSPKIAEKLLEDDGSKLITHEEKGEPDNKSKPSRTSSGFKVTNLSVTKPILNEKAKKEKISDKVREKLKNLDVDYARGESAILTDSSSDDDSSDDSVAEFEENMAHEWGELDKDAGTTDQSTCRLAVCNMDWDRIRAADLMVLFSSFTPVEGYVKSVTIYPSEFGLERMKEEDVKGPTELVSENPKEEDNEDEEGGSYHMEMLRKYQLNRLKYFYAVVECDSVATADKLYSECDGLEYESSAIRLDLRFIPDDMVFDQKPREVCNGIPDPTKYNPRYFITKALQQAKVECTWDETNPDRLEIAEKIMKANGEVDDEDIQAYLASSSGESEAESDKLGDDDDAKIDGNEEERIAKYRALISDIQEKEKSKSSKDVEMEVTWGMGLKNETEKLVKQRLKEQEELTPFEKFLEKRKEKRKLKRKEKKQATSKDEETAFSDDDLPSDVDLNDPYFREELEGLRKGKSKKKGDSGKNKDSGEEASRENYRAQLKLLMMDFEEKKDHFNMDEIIKQEKESGKKKKRKTRKSEEEKPVKDDFEVNTEDPRFDALYSSHLYNIDPADPHFRKTKAMEALVNEKLKRRKELDDSSVKTTKEPEPKPNNKNDPELSLLVKSVKRKAENLKAKKKQKF